MVRRQLSERVSLYGAVARRKGRTGDPSGVWKSCSRGASEPVLEEERHPLSKGAGAMRFMTVVGR